MLVKGKKRLLPVHGEDVLPVHDLGGGIHNRFQAAALPGQELVGALHPQISHGVGILYDKGVHTAVLQAVDGHHVGVKTHKKDILRPLQHLNGPGNSHAGGLVKGDQDIDFRMVQQQGDGIGLGAGSVHQGCGHSCDPGPSALRQGVHSPPDPLLAVCGALVVVDDPYQQRTLHPLQRRLGRHFTGGVVVCSDIGAHMTGAHAAVDGHDVHTALGGRVDGGGVLLVADGGKNDGLRSVLHRPVDHPVLGLVVLLRLRAGNGQVQVVLRGGRPGPGKDGQEKFAVGGLDDEGHRVPDGESGVCPAAAQAGDEQRQKQVFTSSHSRPPPLSSASEAPRWCRHPIRW